MERHHLVCRRPAGRGLHRRLGAGVDGSGWLWRPLGLAAADNRQTQRLWHLHGTTWSQATPNFGKHEWELQALAQVPHTSSVWGVGATRRGSGADGLIGIDGPTPR